MENSLKNKIDALLAEAAEPTAAQATYLGATNPQDQMSSLGTNYEVLELDRPEVTGAEQIQQVYYPGQNQPDPEPVPPQFQYVDPFELSATVAQVDKEAYPMGSGASDVQIQPEDQDQYGENRFSRDIHLAQHPAPMVAEGKEQFKVFKAKKINAKSEGPVIVLDKSTAPEIEKKLGLPHGSLTKQSGSKYSQTVVIKDVDDNMHTVYSKDGETRIRAYGHKNQDATDNLKSHLNEDAAPAQQEAQPDQDVLDQAVAAVQAGNDIEKVAKATGLTVDQIQDAMQSAIPANPPSGTATNAPVSEQALKQDFDNMISEDTDLSESFKEKARPIFEAAVISRVKAEVTRISESMQQSTERQLKQIQESCEEGINVFAEANAARLDKYMSYLGEQWVKQNKLAIQQGIKSELTEGFMRGLQSLFRQHYINVPEHKMEVVAEQKETISKLQESIRQLNGQMQSLTESKLELQKSSIIKRLAEGMTAYDADKLESLCEGIAFENVALFESKVNTVKRNHFSTQQHKSPEQLLESQIQVAASLNESATNTNKKGTTRQHSDPMNAYIAQLDRMAKQ